MKYVTSIDNRYAQKFRLNLAEAAVLDYLFSLPTWAEKISKDDGFYYYASRNKAVQELPLVTTKPDTMYRHYKALSIKGIIRIIKVDGKEYVAFTELAAGWNRGTSEHSEIFPTNNTTTIYSLNTLSSSSNVLGNFSEHSEINPNEHPQELLFSGQVWDLNDLPDAAAARIVEQAIRHGLKQEHVNDFMAEVQERANQFTVRRTGPIGGLKDLVMGFNKALRDKAALKARKLAEQEQDEREEREYQERMKAKEKSFHEHQSGQPLTQSPARARMTVGYESDSIPPEADLMFKAVTSGTSDFPQELTDRLKEEAIRVGLPKGKLVYFWHTLNGARLTLNIPRTGPVPGMDGIVNLINQTYP